MTELTNEFEFLVLACDGIWDVLTNQEVVDFIRDRIAQKMLPETVSIPTVAFPTIAQGCRDILHAKSRLPANSYFLNLRLSQGHSKQ